MCSMKRKTESFTIYAFEIKSWHELVGDNRPVQVNWCKVFIYKIHWIKLDVFYKDFHATRNLEEIKYFERQVQEKEEYSDVQVQLQLQLTCIIHPNSHFQSELMAIQMGSPV